MQIPSGSGPHPIIQAVYKVYAERGAKEPRRGYIGGSSIGKECTRALWFDFRWALREDFEGRILRLFATGHREEERVIQDLRDAGIEVHDLDTDGRQYRATALGGHFSGGLDGVLRKVPGRPPERPFLLEVKTSEPKAFQRLREAQEGGRNAVREVKTVHYDQMQIYMGFWDLKSAIYVCINKATDHWFVAEVKFDANRYQALIERAERILLVEKPPERVQRSSMPPPCCWCNYQDMCFDNQIAEMNCRTCVHASPVIEEDRDDGPWICTRHKKYLSTEEQEAGCEKHLFIPDLIPFAEAVKYSGEEILYSIKKKDGTTVEIANTTDTGFAEDCRSFSSEELARFPRHPGAILEIAKGEREP